MSGLREALGIDGGIVCIVGAGGKKSLQQALAWGYPDRLLLTASARTTALASGLVDAHLHWCAGPSGDGWEVADGQPAAAAGTLPRWEAGQLAAHHRLALTGACFKPERYEGLPEAVIANLHREGGFGLSLVKADGARMRWLKGPAQGEPAAVPGMCLMLPVLSLRALGRPLDEKSAHRPERVAEVTGTALGSPIDAATFARLISHPEGSLRGRGEARVVPVLNMVEPEQTEVAASIARDALAASDAFDRVLLCRLRDPTAPWWQLVTRR